MGMSANPEWLQTDLLERAREDLTARARTATGTFDDVCSGYAMCLCAAELLRRQGSEVKAEQMRRTAEKLLDMSRSYV
jgi:hypothetical protein